MKQIMQFSLLSASVMLAACGGSDNTANPVNDPQTPQTISGQMQKPQGGYEAVSSDNLEYITYKGALVSLREEDAVMNMEERPADRGGMDVDGDYLLVKVGNGYGALRVYDDLSYARFGDLSTFDLSTNSLSDTVGFFQGIPSAELPAGGGAEYNGTAYQFGTTADGKAIADYHGKMTANADFGTGKIHIQLSNVTVPVSATATMSGNTFTESGVIAGRSLLGGFFGPNGAEIAGIVQQSNNGEWTATFGGKR